MEKNNLIKVRLKDNQSFSNAYTFSDKYSSESKEIPEAWWNYIKKVCNINTLIEEYGIFTFPPRNVCKNHDIIQRVNDKLYTYNWVGVVANRDEDGNSVRIEICSRFDDGDKQYFLLFLLCSVLGINIVEISINSENESNYTAILVLLFLMKITDAYGEGLYKEYIRSDYNDFNFKGTLDIKRQIILNNPFVGKTSYSIREYSYDNDILCLIRQTMEYIIDNYPEIWNGYSNNSNILKEFIDVIEVATPSFRMNVDYSERIRSRKEITNPLYQNYEDARKLALMILREAGQNIFDDKDSKTLGVLIDISWLWEEFIAVKLLEKNNFKHLLTDKSRGSLNWAKGEHWYPDYIENKNEKDRRRVFDAKYKVWGWQKDDDIHQLLSYLYLTGGETCGIIFPSVIEKDFEQKYIYAFESLCGRKKPIMYKMPLFIPNSKDINFQEYCIRIDKSIQIWQQNFLKI